MTDDQWRFGVEVGRSDMLEPSAGIGATEWYGALGGRPIRVVGGSILRRGIARTRRRAATGDFGDSERYRAAARLQLPRRPKAAQEGGVQPVAAVPDLHRDRRIEKCEKPKLPGGLGQSRGSAEDRQVQVGEFEFNLWRSDCSLFKVHLRSESPGDPIFACKHRYHREFR